MVLYFFSPKIMSLSRQVFCLTHSPNLLDNVDLISSGLEVRFSFLFVSGYMFLIQESGVTQKHLDAQDITSHICSKTVIYFLAAAYLSRTLKCQSKSLYCF